MSGAIALKGRTVLSGKVVPPNVVDPLHPKVLRQHFAAVIKPFRKKIVARAAGDRVEKTVEHWRRGRSMADAESLFRLANSDGELGPAVWAFIQAKCGRGDAEFYEPHANAEREFQQIR